MANAEVTLSQEGRDFMKNLENGTLGLSFHDTKNKFGQFPYGYNETLHNQFQKGNEWKEECAKEKNSDQETTWYTEDIGWSDEAANQMFDELLNTHLVVEIEKLANDSDKGLKADVASQLTQYQWDAICSIAWNIGVPSLQSLFETLNNSADIDNDGAAWIKSKNTTESSSAKTKAYIEERRRCESEWWLTGDIEEYHNVNDSVTEETEVAAVTESNAKAKNYTTDGGNGKTEESVEEKPGVYSHISPVYIVKNNGDFTKTNLFSCDFYYLQNMYVTDDLPDEVLKYSSERELCSKALLYLHTLPFVYGKIKDGTIKSFFNDNDAKHGGREKIPYGFSVFVGGLIWRHRWFNEHGDDPIRYGEPAKAELYKKPQSGDDPILLEDKNKNLVFSLIPKASASEYSVKYSDIVNNTMDIYTENALVYEFESFANNQFAEIMRDCELRIGIVNQVPEPTLPIGTSVTYNADQSSITGNNIRKILPMTYQSYKKVESALSDTSKTLYDMMNTLEGGTLFEIKIDTGGEDDGETDGIEEEPEEDVSDWFVVTNFGKYLVGFYNRDEHILQTYFSETNVVHRHFESLFNNIAFAITVGRNKAEEDSSVRIRKQYYEDYLKGFTNTMFYYARNQADQDNRMSRLGNNTDNLPNDRELKLSLYLELKNIWDRWICGYFNSGKDGHMNYFDVVSKTNASAYQNTMFANFVFIDSFYTDISHLMRLNCDQILRVYNSDIGFNSKDGKNRVNVHLGNIASVHKCMMYNMPDFVGFDNNLDNIKPCMEDLFKPIPASKIPEPSVMNKFVVIYANFAGVTETNAVNSFNDDGFDIYSFRDGTSIAPTVFGKNSAKTGLVEKPHMGYTVPAFCVEYSRQTNSYWMNLGVSMENNANTSQATLTLSHIAEKGNTSKRQVCFYGQDIYPIYKAYSYFVTIEMMGNAQIQPLMYFQLLNIPMFNGAYMVMSVEHDISPGRMRTIIKGMKMSKVRPPYTKYWFTVSDPGQIGDESSSSDFTTFGDSVGIVGTHGEFINIADDNLEEAIRDAMTGHHLNCDTFVRKVYNSNDIGVDIKHTLKGREVNMFQELSQNNEEWEFHEFTSAAYKGNNWKPLWSGKEHPRCGDLLFGYHDGVRGGATNEFDHVSIYLGFAGEHSSDIFVAEGDSVGGSTFRDDPKGAHISRIQDSKMGLGTDMITHWARCKKYNVKQKSDADKEEEDLRIKAEQERQAEIEKQMNEITQTGEYAYNNMVVPNSTTGQQMTVQTWGVVSDSSNSNPYYSPSGKTYYYVDDFLKKGDKNIQTVSIYNKNKKNTYVHNVRQNLQNLIDNVLNPAVDMYLFEQQPFYTKTLVPPNVTSGFRNKKKNENTVGASSTSQHLYGEAADLQFGISDQLMYQNLVFAQTIAKYCNFDQLIIEKPKRAIKSNRIEPEDDLRCRWIHVSYSTSSAQIGRTNKKQILVIVIEKNKDGKDVPRTVKSLTPQQLINYVPPNI